MKFNKDTDSIDFTVSENGTRGNIGNSSNSLALLGGLQNWASKPPQRCEESGQSFHMDDVDVQSIDTFTLNRSRRCSTHTNLELKSVSSFGERKSSVVSFGTDLERCDSFSALAKSRSLDNITMCSQDTLGHAYSLETLGDIEDEHFPTVKQGMNGVIDPMDTILGSDQTYRLNPRKPGPKAWSNPAYEGSEGEGENRTPSSQSSAQSESSDGTIMELPNVQ